MFRQNHAIFREQLCSFLSHFSTNMVGDKSQEYDGPYIPAWLVSYHIDAEVAQKGTQSLPEDGMVLPKHEEPS
jgi:hypothetical protein